MEKIVRIQVEKIEVGKNEQRLDMDVDGIEDLARSIQRLGVLVPLYVTCEGDSYMVLCGHRRLRAARVAGLKEIPCIVVEHERRMEVEMTFAENFFRRDLSPVELACSLKDCMEKEIMTMEELAAGMHKSEHWVRSMIAIAGWPADVQEAIHVKAISVSAASNLALVTDEDYRGFLLRNAAESGATARTTAAWLQAWRAMQPPEEAINETPVAAGPAQVPMIPQAPCLCCSQMFEVNMMSHVPVCGECIKLIRQIGISG